MNRSVLEAVAELADRGLLQEKWSEGARKAALEARKRAGHTLVHADGNYAVHRNPAGSFDPSHKGVDLSDNVSYATIGAAKKRIEQHKEATGGGSPKRGGVKLGGYVPARYP